MISKSHPRALFTGIVAACFGLASLSACSSDSSDPVADDCKPVAKFDTIVPNKLTVTAVQEAPSIEVDPSTKKVGGMDGTLLGGFAKENCLELDIQVVAGPAAIAAMTENKADVGGGGWSKSPERAEVMGLSETTYWGPLAIVSTTGVEDIPSLKGLKVGVVGGSASEAPAIEAFGASNVKSYQSHDVMLNDIEAGRLDAGLSEGPVAAVTLAKRGGELVSKTVAKDANYEALTYVSEQGYVYQKNNAELGAALDAFVLKAREKGMIADALAKFGITDKIVLTGSN